MMKPYTNHSSKTATIGTRRLEPGQTRLVEETMIPGFAVPPAPPERPIDDLAELLEGSVKQVTESLPGLDQDQLDRVRNLESGGKQRKGVLNAIEEQVIERAASSADDGEVGGANA